MNFETIEKAYALLLENVQFIQNQLKTTFYDALIEQNVLYVTKEATDVAIVDNNKSLENLALSAEEWRRAFQFLLIKASQTELLQLNHQLTPDSIGFIILYLLEELTSSAPLDVLEIGSGTGNLAYTLLNNSPKDLHYMGIEVDDLLIDLSASIADVMQVDAQFIQEDAVRPQLMKPSDVIISDLPIGYYPNDEVAKRYQVASHLEHTYAHHLLMEQSIKYLKTDGLAIFLAPNNLLTSPQSDLLKGWITQAVSILAVIALPENLFGHKKNAKSIFVFKKRDDVPKETFVYQLGDLQRQESMLDLIDNFQKWRTDNG
ncbi:class I SAM-dependent methyltransferase [Streptococcus sciuri]|uniref:Class I SAM-dependent methyltransferase n=1 Tax=Streptococcus sciuri TaxID=2973939 RepID=A0ABT2F8R1_9STRE|nr:class I SAM-dependent methyltransferase [Streptococcus sciuri]MCS4488804.1 class I SAM-dependent methyltransferase [Streptococcus sciuri]